MLGLIGTQMFEWGFIVGALCGLGVGVGLSWLMFLSCKIGRDRR